MHTQISLTGELTIASCHMLRDKLKQALSSAEPVHIDLTAVERVDTAASQLLLAAQREAANRSIPIHFNCSTTVSKRLATLGVHL